MPELSNQLNPQTITDQPLEPQPPKPHFPRPLILSLLLIILTLSLSLAYLFFSQSQTNKVSSINSYEDCVAAGNGQANLMYPPTCTTPDGRTFTDPTADPVEPPDQPDKSQLEDPTANWQTYTNEYFSFKYPYGWNIEENSQATQVTIYNYDPSTAPGRSYNPQTDQNLFKIQIGIADSYTELTNWLANEKSQISPVTDNVRDYQNETQLLINNQQAVYIEFIDEFTRLPIGTTAISSPNNKLILAYGGLNFSDNKDIYNQILSTFQLIAEKSSIPNNWQTYYDQEFGFSFKHPNLKDQICNQDDTYNMCEITFPGLNSDQKIIELAEGITENWFKGPEHPFNGLAIYLLNSNKSDSLEEFANQQINNFTNLLGIDRKFNSSSDLIKNAESIRVINDSKEYDFTFISRNENDDIFIIARTQFTLDFDETYNQILSTFEFLD